MSVQAAETRSRYNFEPFSTSPEYQAITRGFVRKTLPCIASPIESTQRLVIGEVAPGTGLATGEMVALLAGKPAFIVGVDNNEYALHVAKQKVPSIGRTLVQFIVGDGRNLPLAPESADAIYMTNAIHEIPGKENKMAILHSIAISLKPGGWAFINSAFTRELFPSRHEIIKWGNWKKRAMDVLEKGKNPQAPKFEIYSTEEYCQMMEGVGLVVDRSAIQIVEVRLTADSLRAISLYDTFIEGTFMDMQDTKKFTLEEKSDALIQVLDAMEKEYRQETEDPKAELTFGRNWVEIIAIKKQADL